MFSDREAIQIYLEAHQKARQVIERIKRWDSEKTLKENAIDLGENYQNALNLARFHRLPYK